MLPCAGQGFAASACKVFLVSHTTRNLLVPPRIGSDRTGLVNRVTAQDAGWDSLNIETWRLGHGQTWQAATGEHEAVLVVLGGRISVRSNRGQWPVVGRRRDVFAGMPHALYLPRRTEFQVTALSALIDLAWAWAPTDRDHQARHVAPADVEIEIRGGGNATRQINSIVPPGFPCHRLVCVEVYTPGGNWSSYPPHKHDVHRTDASGNLMEADLDEIYCYRFHAPEGFAFQRVYAADGSFDVALTARQDDIVLVPEGYHPVSAAYGYTCYYLNFLAGSAQSLANSEDPQHAWVKHMWRDRDPRVPVVTHAMEVTDGG